MNKYLFPFLFILTLLVLPSKVAAQGNQAIFSYQPASGSAQTNSNLSIDIRVNSASNITSVKANLTFNPTYLSVASIDSSTSSFGTQWEQTFDNTAGTINLQRSTPSPGVSGDNLIAKITFKAKTTLGDTTVGYHTNCFATSNPICLALKPDNTNILVSGNTATFTITASPTSTPTPTPTSVPSSDGGGGGGGGSSGGGGGGGGGGSSGGGGGGGGGSNPADLNKDGRVNIFDLSILLRNFNKSGQGDINNDGKVNIFDLSILLRAWTR